MIRSWVTFVCASIVLSARPSLAAELRFLRDGALVREIGLEELKEKCEVAAVVIDDPYYGKKKSFLAFSLKQVLRLGFGGTGEGLAKQDFLFAALDGYVKPATAARALEDGGYVAFADTERTHGAEPRWEPIDRRGLDPGPFYVVWTKPGQTDANGFPWPFQLYAIEIVHFEKKYPHTLPTTAPAGSAAWKGFATFRAHCISCHAINGEGGKLGPDLNVPQSILEYRPVAQVKAYIRDPETFRHSNMPAHPDLSDAQLDELIAYFSTMKALKHEPAPGR